jgi:membrane protein
MKKIGKFFRETAGLFKDTFTGFGRRDPFRNSAVIAYFAIFSLPGLLVIVINVAGYFMGTETLQTTVSGQVGELIGPGAAEDIDGIVANAQADENTTLASIVSIATLIFGATGIFYHLQKTLNIMWGVEPEPEKKLLKVLRDRLFSFGMILVAGFLMIISLLVSSLLAALSGWISRNFFSEAVIFIQLLEILLSVAVITVMFAAMFKFLPDAIIGWRDVWVGAFVTTLLFLLAKYALSLYFGKAEPGSVYGAAGSIVLVMLWVTYSGLILLFGAEFTRAYADRYGAHIRLPEHARWRRGRERDQEGRPAR